VDDLAVGGPTSGWLQTFTIGVLVGVIAVVGLRNRRAPALGWVLAAVSLGLTALAVLRFVAQYKIGFPGTGSLLAVIGGLAVAAGALLILPVPPGRWRLPPVRSGLSAAAAVLLAAAIATPLVLTAPEWPVTSGTASATGTPPPIPDSVTQVAWSTEVDGRVRDVVAGGTGAVVLFEDGVAGVDGTTGDLRWSRRRAGSEAKNIYASPDGRTVLVQLNPYDQDSFQWEAVDAITGELRFTEPSTGRPFSGTQAWMTNTSFIRADLKRTKFTAHSLTDGSELWTYSAPDDCRIVNDSNQFLAHGTGFLLALGCGREVRYVSLDGATGKIQWQHEWRVPEPQYTEVDVRIDRATDGRLVQVYVPDATTETQFTVFDTETGTVVPAPLDLNLRTSGIGIVDAPDGRKLWDVRANHPVATESGDVLRCALDQKTLLRGGLLCADSSVTPYVKDGTAKLSIVRFGETAVRPLTVSLGGPFAVQTRPLDPFVSEAVFGAVVGYTTYQPADGHRSQIVGLR
jgi:outer membrane protein assembly factor BamB